MMRAIVALFIGFVVAFAAIPLLSFVPWFNDSIAALLGSLVGLVSYKITHAFFEDNGVL